MLDFGDIAHSKKKTNSLSRTGKRQFWWLTELMSSTFRTSSSEEICLRIRFIYFIPQERRWKTSWNPNKKRGKNKLDVPGRKWTDQRWSDQWVISPSYIPFISIGYNPVTTHPETNIFAENWWLGDYFPFGRRLIFRGKLLVLGRVFAVGSPQKSRTHNLYNSLHVHS